MVDSGCPFYPKLLHDSKDLFQFSLVQVMVLKTEVCTSLLPQENIITLRIISINASSNLHGQESLSY